MGLIIAILGKYIKFGYLIKFIFKLSLSFLKVELKNALFKKKDLNKIQVFNNYIKFKTLCIMCFFNSLMFCFRHCITQYWSCNKQ